MTTHTNCSHPATKADRAKCRRAKGASAYAVTKTTRRVGVEMLEPCSCNGPAANGICALCDRLAQGQALTRELARCA